MLCSGKIYFELQDHIDELKLDNIHIIRLEQLYPFPYEALEEELIDFKNCEMIWCKKNQKTWALGSLFKKECCLLLKSNWEKRITLYWKKSAASPATGVFDRHLSNQKNIIRLATEANLDEIKKEKSGVSLVKYKLPIE